MIELPEAANIAGQMASALAGKRIKSAMRGNAAHKFAFYSRPAEEYARILAGKRIGRAEVSGSTILLPVEPGYLLVLGGGGERIQFHESAATLPKKHQLLLEFDDGTLLTVTVQGWGSCQLFTPAELNQNKWFARRSLSPVEEGFTADYFVGLFAKLAPEDSRSVKFFIISEPGVWGVANGYLQDILFRARIHPRTRAVALTTGQRKTLYRAMTDTIKLALKQHGRDDEYGLLGQPGRYHRLLSAESAGQPCPQCKATIVKERFLGGAIYFCPSCQPMPTRKMERRK
jgi:formamidopyrimidine-DNA glycosylase